MTKSRRWIDRLIVDAAACRARLPWERGLRRSGFIARRPRPAEPPVRVRRAS